MDLKESADLNVFGQTTLTNMPPQSTDTTGMMEHSTKETSEQLTLPQFQTQTLSLADFLANLSVLLASEEDSQILEAHCSLKSAESLGLKELSIYFLRTSKDCSRMMKGIHSKPLSQRWMNWGMTVNGKCLTASIMEFPKVESVFTLSQILEKNPEKSYFLTLKQLKAIIKWQKKQSQEGKSFGMALYELDLQRISGGGDCIIRDGNDLRWKTEREYERLQGFPDDWTKCGIDKNNQKINILSSQRYKCCGNAVTTNVITDIAERLK